MRNQVSSWRVGVLVGAVLVLAAVTSGPALAVGPGLPRAYNIQRIDAPLPALAGGIGYPLINIGDVNSDGKDDLASEQSPGTPNGDGAIYLFSGATGALISTINSPDPGGTGSRSVIDKFMDRLSDIGSCPGGQSGVTCPNATIGGPDGKDEIMVGAEGIDVGGVTDVGRVWILDGATRAVLKRLDMPPADRAILAARQAENPTSNLRGGFGRTVGNPRGLPPCAGNAGVGACLPTGATLPAIPTAVRIGDIDGAGQPDIVVGANRFPENAGTANPQSHCATAAAVLCNGAGRVYVYRGEDIAGTNPATNLETPLRTIKSPAAQADALETSELFGHAQMPVGDVGRCDPTKVPGGVINPGEKCPIAASTNAGDGKPEFVIAAHRADYPLFNPDPSYIEVGASFLIDGATGAVLFNYLHPEPQASAFFGYTLHQTFAFGDLGSSLLPDLIQPAMGQNNQNTYGAGRDYVINGNFKTTDINPAQLSDPTPITGGYFGVPVEAVGDLDPNEPGNEAIVGNFALNSDRNDAFTDIHFFNPWNEDLLQTIKDPDNQIDSAFGYSIVPLGDLNGDGFLDFAAGSPRWDAPAVGTNTGLRDQGRFYIFRSDNSPASSGGGGITQPTPTTPTTPAKARAARSVKLRASKKRIPRRGKLTLRGTIDAVTDRAACESGQRVAIQRSKSKSGRFRTFKQVKSTATGAFKLGLRPTKTYFYRARVTRTTKCVSAASNKLRVRVSP